MYISKLMLNAAYPVCLVYMISNIYILKALGTKILFKHRYLHKVYIVDLVPGGLSKKLVLIFSDLLFYNSRFHKKFFWLDFDGF